MSYGVVDLHDGTVAVFSPFSAKDELKAIYGARWNPNRRCWIVPSFMAHRAQEIVNRHTRGEAKPSSTMTTTWSKAMFAALPARLHEPAFKALVRVVHPDVGGDARAAQELNDAYSRARTRRVA